MTRKKENTRKPEEAKPATPPVEDLDIPEKDAKDTRGGKVNMADLSFTKTIDKSSP